MARPIKTAERGQREQVRITRTQKRRTSQRYLPPLDLRTPSGRRTLPY